jgi:hypothetical protein
MDFVFTRSGENVTPVFHTRILGIALRVIFAACIDLFCHVDRNINDRFDVRSVFIRRCVLHILVQFRGDIPGTGCITQKGRVCERWVDRFIIATTAHQANRDNRIGKSLFHGSSTSPQKMFHAVSLYNRKGRQRQGRCMRRFDD